jgi:hypothetical protein
MPGTDSLRQETTFTDTIQYIENPNPRFSESLADTMGYPVLIRSKSPEKITVSLPVKKRDNLFGNQQDGAIFQDWSIGLIVFMFVLLASVRFSKEKYLLKLFQSAVNNRAANKLFRERILNIYHVAIRLDLLFYLTMGFFLFHIIMQLSQPHIAGYLLYLISAAGISLFLILKKSIYYFTGYVFDTMGDIKEFYYYQKLGNHLIGIFLLPIVLLLYLLGGTIDWVLIGIGLVILLFFSAIAMFRGMRIIAKKVFSIYYLFLYLCTLEILPLVLVWRILWRE